MPTVLRIVCWNIAEGCHDFNLPPNGALPALAEQIRGRSADIVLLNEARVDKGSPLGTGVNQFGALAAMTGLVHWDYVALRLLETVLRPFGWKCVGVLSRYPILSKRVIQVMRGGVDTGYGTGEFTVEINGLIHHIFTTRFDAANPADNETGVRQAVAAIQAIDVGQPVIFGGDFNAGVDTYGFQRDSGLTWTWAERPDQGFGTLSHIDHVLYRGPYRVTQMEQRCWMGTPNPAPAPGLDMCPLNAPSDHPSVFVELTTPPGDSVAIYNGTIRLKHLPTVGVLHSHSANYGHPGGSGEQQVTAFGGADGNDFWRLKGPHGSPGDYLACQPISHANVIRLEHMATRCNLHSHAGVFSPVTRQQEVSCFGQNGLGDFNDDWRVEVDGGGPWTFGKRVRLIHVATNYALHSHYGYSHPQWTMGQQEVTCFAGRDDNDWWYLTEIQALNAAEFVGQTASLVMAPDATQSVSLTFLNTGATIWDPNQGYCLGSQAPQDNQSWGRNRLPLPAAVAPGAECTFTFPITAPSRAGDLGFQWRMVQEHVEWFGQESPLIQIHITPRDLQVSVTPFPVPLNRAVTVTVHAADAATRSTVSGQVRINGAIVGNTGVPFMHTFTPLRRQVRPGDWEVTYPEGTVRASGFREASIDFGFFV